MKNTYYSISYCSSFQEQNIATPSSKSYLIRVLFLAALSSGRTTIQGVFDADDVVAVLRVIETMGAKISRQGNGVTVEGTCGKLKGGNYHCGESGLCVRIASVLSLLANEKVVILGRDSVLNRQFETTVDLLSRLGMKVESRNNHLPLNVSGTITTTRIEIDASGTSQIVSGVLLVLPFLPAQTELVVKNLVSISYVEMTLAVLKQFGYRVKESVNEIQRTYQVELAGIQFSNPLFLEAPPDWSGVAFWLVAATIGGDLHFNDLACAPKHTDAVILEVLQQAGVVIEKNACTLTIKKSIIRGFEFDATHYPDLFPPLVVLALWADGVSKIRGVHRLLNKESNRAEVLQTEFRRLGADISIQADTMVIEPTALNGGILVDAHGDHRIAMALAITGLFIKKGLRLDGYESVSKSYPQFFKTMERLIK